MVVSEAVADCVRGLLCDGQLVPEVECSDGPSWIRMVARNEVLTIFHCACAAEAGAVQGSAFGKARSWIQWLEVVRAPPGLLLLQGRSGRCSSWPH